MAEDIKLTVINTLKRQRRPCTTLDLARALSMKRQQVNPLLYDLQKQGLINKVRESNPPMWDLSPEGAIYGCRKSAGRGILGAVRSSPSIGTVNHTQTFGTGMASSDMSHSHTTFPSRGAHTYSTLQQDIINVLERAKTAMTALEVAKGVGLKTRKEVNPDLYALQKMGVVSMDQSKGPPLWTVVKTAASQPRPQEWEQDMYMESDSTSDPYQKNSDEERMDTQPDPSLYTSTSVDLSQVPEGDLRQRLLLVMEERPDIQRTELELCKAVQTKTSRPEIKLVLESLLKEGKLKKTHSIPTKWWIASNGTGSASKFLNPCAPSFVPGGVTLSMSQTLPVATTSSFSAMLVSDMNKNPVSALSEYCQASKIELTFVEVREFGPPHKKHFVIAAQVGNERYEAESTNKKEAKRMAADLALQAIQVRCPPTITNNITVCTVTGAFSDKIADLSHACYGQVQSTVDYPQPGRKVIAAFVMEDMSSGEMKVVSIGSGTRCITGDNMSLEGCVVNDSHAEVIARRSLIRFFYKQLLIFYGGVSSNSVFTASEGQSSLLHVKENLKFHLYISTAPCGDGAQFSRDDDQNRDPPEERTHLPTMQGKSQGILRTKMEGGEGTIPIGPDTTRPTWDGILQGGRLRTMSCSDKVGRWNVIGLQGSLLSLFIHPVYMSSLTLGSLHHHGHLSRAVCCRFADLKEKLPAGFTVNHPSLGRVQGGDEMKRHTEKTSNFSLNWSIGDDRGELINGGEGCPVLHKSKAIPSRVAKISLYSDFIKLSKVSNRFDLLTTKSYRETKELAGPFQKAKEVLYEYCRSKGYGAWMRKPVEEKEFDITVLERLKKNSYLDQKLI